MQERRENKLTALRSIRGKLFWLRIGIGVAMSFSIGIYCYLIISHSMQEERMADLERDILLIVDLTRRKVEDQKEVVAHIANAPEVQKYFSNASVTNPGLLVHSTVRLSTAM